MAITIQTEYFTKEQVESERDKIFVFGDNLARKGTGGQAKACRDQPNTIGIVTKWDEKRNTGSYMYDETYEINRKIIMKDFDKVFELIRDRNKDGTDVNHIVFPADGFGTGLANLSTNAPKTLQFISDVTAYIIEVDRINQLDKKLLAESKRLWPEGFFHSYKY